MTGAERRSLHFLSEVTSGLNIADARAMCFSLIPYFGKITTTQLILILTITLAVAFTVIVVTIALIIRKIYQETVRRREESLEKTYQNLILDYLFSGVPYHLPQDGVPRASPRIKRLILPIQLKLPPDGTYLRSEHFHVVKLILLDYSQELVGETRVRLTLLFHELGFVAKEIVSLRNRKWWVRAEAARNLGLMGARIALKPLLQATEDPHPDVRAESMQALFDLFKEDALPPLLPLLKDLSPWMVIRLSNDILKLQSKAVLQMLDGLEARDQTVQVLLIDLLGEIRDLRAYEKVKTMASHEDPEVRAAAMVALGKFGEPRGERHLVKALSDPDPAVRLGAAKGLKHLGSPSSVRALQRALHDDVFEVRHHAGIALGACAEAGRKALVRALKTKNSDVNKIAEEILDDAGYFDKLASA